MNMNKHFENIRLLLTIAVILQNFVIWYCFWDSHIFIYCSALFYMDYVISILLSTRFFDTFTNYLSLSLLLQSVLLIYTYIHRKYKAKMSIIE